MEIESNLLKRINELARKNKTIGLTEEEKIERDKLRKEYLKNFRENMITNVIDNIYIVDEDGNKRKIEKKKN